MAAGLTSMSTSGVFVVVSLDRLKQKFRELAGFWQALKKSVESMLQSDKDVVGTSQMRRSHRNDGVF